MDSRKICNSGSLVCSLHRRRARGNARYASSKPGPEAHDERQGMAVGPEQANPNEVIAITLLQEPLLCRSKEFENNSIFIAAARSDIPKLVEEVRRLKEELGKLKIP